MNRKRVAVNAILNTIKTGLGIVFPLITYPYVSRVLGVDNIGIYNFSASMVSYFLLIAALGISTYGIREGTQYREDRDKITGFANEIFSINCLSMLASYALLAVVLLIPFFKPYRPIILLLSLEILFTTIGVSWICNIYEDFLAISLRTIGMQFLSLILLFSFVKNSGDLLIYVGIILVSNSAANLFNWFYVRKKYCKVHFTAGIDWKRHLKPILIIFSTTVAISIYVSSDVTMLGFMTDDFHVGIYGTATKIYTIAKTSLVAVLIVFIPGFSSMMACGEFKKVESLFQQVSGVLSLLVLPMTVGLFMISDDLVLLISGQDFEMAGTPLRLLSVAIFFSLYSYLLTQCILIPAKKEGVVFKATLISAVSNIILNFILIPFWDVNAAAITTIIAEAVTFIMTYMAARPFVGKAFTLKKAISYALGCIAIVVICLGCRKIDVFGARLVCSVVLSAIGYFLCLLLTGNRALNNLTSILKRSKEDTYEKERN